MRTNPIFRVEVLRQGELTPGLIEQWIALEERSVEPNAFLSPHFVLPALRHLPGEGEPLFLAVWDGAAVPQLVGMGVFNERGATARFPLPHLVAYRCAHSYLTGLLIDRAYADDVARAYLEYFVASRSVWHGVAFSARPADGALDRALVALGGTQSLGWFERYRATRAILVPATLTQGLSGAAIGAHRVSEAHRAWRRLAECGTLEWRALRGEDISGADIDDFLALEDRGWRHTGRTSLRSRPGHEVFFREMTEAFRRDQRLFLTVLRLNDRTIASSCNFLSGQSGFAFKIGWDPNYAKYSPGILNEVGLLERTPEWLKSLNYVDSGAVEGSFIEKWWPDHRTLTSGMFATTRLACVVLRGFEWMRTLKHRTRR